jgi:hypothetical protein
MEALAERLSHLDSQAEGARRVVMFYDTLMRRRVDLPALARASAALADCAVRSQLPLDHIGGLVCPARPVKAAPLAEVGVILATTLGFTTPRQPVVHYDSLGALALLAQVPQDTARDNPDVAAIARMAGNPQDLETLDAYCHTSSLRQAADLLHLHHSSWREGGRGPSGVGSGARAGP